MEKITGIGGFFFRSRNPDTLNEWYERNLGIRGCGQEYSDGSWWQDAGPTVFSADAVETWKPDQNWYINFRVKDLDAMVAQLRKAGVEVKVEETVYPNGRFAHLHDPEGNQIELWEPGGADMRRPTYVTMGQG